MKWQTKEKSEIFFFKMIFHPNLYFPTFQMVIDQWLHDLAHHHSYTFTNINDPKHEVFSSHWDVLCWNVELQHNRIYKNERQRQRFFRLQFSRSKHLSIIAVEEHEETPPTPSNGLLLKFNYIFFRITNASVMKTFVLSPWYIRTSTHPERGIFKEEYEMIIITEDRKTDYLAFLSFNYYLSWIANDLPRLPRKLRKIVNKLKNKGHCY